MIYQFHDFSLDTRLYQLKRKKDVSPIEPKVFDLLVYLADHSDRVVPRQELLDSLWPGRAVSDTALSACLKAARRALGDNGRSQKIIKTVHGRGYQFVAPVSCDNLTTTKPADTSERSSGSSIAVLPFANASDGKGQQYFAEGIAHNIAMDLSRSKSLVVIYADWLGDGERSAQNIASELNVRYLLKGGVQRLGERVRVSVDFIDGDTGAIRWSDRFDRRGSDAIEIQDDISQKITAALWGYRGQIQDADMERMTRKSTDSFDAYDFLLRGVMYKELYTREDNARAIECFRKAIALDPLYAYAYSWLAWVYGMEVSMQWTDKPQAMRKLALETAQKAIELDHYCPIGHTGLGFAQVLLKNFDEALAAFDRCLELYPNHADCIALRADALVFCGRAREAAEEVHRAMKLNPYHPDWYLWVLGCACYQAKQYEESVGSFNRMKSQNSDSLMWLTAGYAQIGDTDKARRQRKQLLDINPGFTLSGLTSFFKDPLDNEHLREGLVKAGFSG